MIWRTLGAKSIDDLKANWPTYKDTSTLCSPITHVSKGDAPVYLVYGVNTKTPVLKGDGIHHAEFGRILKERCDEVGVECHLQILNESKPAVSRGDFIKRLFGQAK
jgi:hypothetical protein